MHQRLYTKELYSTKLLTSFPGTPQTFEWATLFLRTVGSLSMSLRLAPLIPSYRVKHKYYYIFQLCLDKVIHCVTLSCQTQLILLVDLVESGIYLAR